jgi:hypothetical protein
MPTEKAVCQNPMCGEPYVKQRETQRYCSVNCRIQVQNSHINNGKTCKWCGERFKVTFETRSRSHCYKQECIQKQWYWGMLKMYSRCKNCNSIIPRGKNEWGSVNYCPFCLGSIKHETREKYVYWLKNLPRHVTALLPTPAVATKNSKQYVKAYDINNVKFQIFYPHNNKNSELKTNE